MSAPLRVGVIGCGNVLGAYRPELERLRARGWTEAVAACGWEPQRDAARAAFPAARFTTQAEEVYQAPDVDLVAVLTSMPQHGPLAVAAFRAGKHVLVEKPLATSLADAAELVALAGQGGGQLCCAPFTTLSPTFQALGARYGWAGPSGHEWFYKPGGGCLLDLGIYCVTSLTGLLGPVRRMTALTGVANSEPEINGRTVAVEAEDNAQVLLEFAGGALGVVTSGFTMQKYRGPALKIYSTAGTIQMLGDDWDPDGYELWRNDAGCWETYPEAHPESTWTDGLRHLVACVRGEETPRVTPAQSYHVLEILLQAQKSAREGRALKIESTFEAPPFSTPLTAEAAHLRHDRTREH